LRKLLELRVSLDVVTDLQRGEADVERADDLVILRRRARRESVGWTARANEGKQQQAGYKGDDSQVHKIEFRVQALACSLKARDCSLKAEL